MLLSFSAPIAKKDGHTGIEKSFNLCLDQLEQKILLVFCFLLLVVVIVLVIPNSNLNICK